jgi:hypothetical protein
MIEQVLIISLIVMAIWFSMQEGEIFHGLAKWYEKTFPEAIQKPLHECPICLCPLYGSGLYWVIPWGKLHMPPAELELWPFVVVAAMGLNVVIVKLWPEKD